MPVRFRATTEKADELPLKGVAALLSGPATALCGPGLPGLLDRRARDVCIRTEHAAVALQRTQNIAAMLAVLKKLAGIHWHCLGRDAPALGEGERRAERHHSPPRERMRGASMKLQRAEIVTMPVATHSSWKVLRAGGAVVQVASRSPHPRRRQHHMSTRSRRRFSISRDRCCQTDGIAWERLFPCRTGPCFPSSAIRDAPLSYDAADVASNEILAVV